MEISRHEEIFVEARQTIEKLEEVIKKVTSPANRIGTFLGSVGKDTAHIVVGGSDYYCNVDPRIPMAKLNCEPGAIPIGHRCCPPKTHTGQVHTIAQARPSRCQH